MIPSVRLTVVNSYEQFAEALAHAKAGAERSLFYVIGDRNQENGSWCPDCRDSDAVILPILSEMFLGKLPIKRNTNLITVLVGDRPTWKDQTNKYRTEHGINSIPTLLLVDGHKGGQTDSVTREEVVSMLTTE